jgi:general stress protein CsbA
VTAAISEEPVFVDVIENVILLARSTHSRMKFLVAVNVDSVVLGQLVIKYFALNEY